MRLINLIVSVTEEQPLVILIQVKFIVEEAVVKNTQTKRTSSMLIDTYIVRLYQHEVEVNEGDANEVIGVVEIAGQEVKQYFTRIDELPVIINQLRKSKLQTS